MRGNDEALKVCDEHYKCARNSSGLVSVLEGARAKKERDAVALADRLARKVQCPECGKRVTPAGLQMHARVSHADTAVDVAGALRAFEERRTAPPSVKETSHGVAAASVDTKNWKG
jgi:DNA-directed RNA polymerase subunit RPC12/RpoP